MEKKVATTADFALVFAATSSVITTTRLQCRDL